MAELHGLYIGVILTTYVRPEMILQVRKLEDFIFCFPKWIDLHTEIAWLYIYIYIVASFVLLLHVYIS